VARRMFITLLPYEDETTRIVWWSWIKKERDGGDFRYSKRRR